MSGEIKTQGSQIWVLDTTQSPPALIKISNNTQLGDFGPQGNDIDVTNLESTAMEKLSGLPDNGDVTLNLNLADIVSHRWLSDNVNGDRFRFLVGYSDGTGVPTIGALDTITPPTGRTCDAFLASVKSFRKSVNTNDAIRATAALVVSGAITTTWKSENP